MLKKISLWIAVVSPVLIALWATMCAMDIMRVSIPAAVLVIILFVLAEVLTLLVSQHCWEKLK